MAASQFVDAIQRTLSPQMAARGFGSGGPGWSSDGRPYFLYCVGAQELAARWPETIRLLGSHTEVKLDRPEWCLDFVVEASPTGQPERVDFEFVELEVLLRSAGFEDLAQQCHLDELRKLNADEMTSVIAEAVNLLMPCAPER